MKRVILPLLLLSISCGVSFGKSVDESTAKSIGYNFLQSQGNALKQSDLSLAYQATSVVNGSNVTDFYVFNSAGGGFVMVAGDDKITPVIAYDPTSSFTYSKSLVNVKGWLNTYTKEINQVIQKNIEPTAATTEQWDLLLQNTDRTAARTTATTTVAPLVPVQWNQTPFVNALCPYDPSMDSLTITGCVATAMAQVMRYWRWPVTGTGSHSYGTPYGMLSANFAVDTFKWSLMPPAITDTNLFVSRLMLDAGVSVNMNYGVAESGAFVTEASSPITNCAEYALQTYFGYQASTMQGVSRYSYDDSDWVHLLKGEINAKRPVIYTGDGSQGGHCFIADGYTAANRIHFNWGWGGYCNGYYTVESLVPGGTDFNNDQTLIIGIMPDTVTLTPAVPPVPPVTGVQTVTANGVVNIYPNPASDVINIDLQGTKVTQVRLTDMQGRVLSTVTPVANAAIITIPVNEFAEGMYLVALQTAQGIQTKKIVVTR